MKSYFPVRRGFHISFTSNHIICCCFRKFCVARALCPLAGRDVEASRALLPTQARVWLLWEEYI